MTSFNIGKHTLKTRTVKGSPGQTVINVGVINLKFGLVRYIIVNNELLIFNGLLTFLGLLAMSRKKKAS